MCVYSLIFLIQLKEQLFTIGRAARSTVLLYREHYKSKWAAKWSKYRETEIEVKRERETEIESVPLLLASANNSANLCVCFKCIGAPSSHIFQSLLKVDKYRFINVSFNFGANVKLTLAHKL